jgi:DNA-binding NtrC family response regulator
MNAVREAERRALARAWGEADGNVSRASRFLGGSRPTLCTPLRERESMGFENGGIRGRVVLG